MKFEPAVQALYASFSQEQNDQLAIRGHRPPPPTS